MTLRMKQSIWNLWIQPADIAEPLNMKIYIHRHITGYGGVFFMHFMQEQLDFAHSFLHIVYSKMF